jgi:hypothetical protein
MGTAHPTFAGIDWGTTSHQVCVLRDGARPQQRSFTHSHQGLVELVGWLTGQAGSDPACLKVAIEVPHGPVVASLLAAGFLVFSLNPKQLDRFRDRRSVAGAKDDRLDALTLADSLRTDEPKFSAVTAPDALLAAIRAASRRRQDALEDLRSLANRLFAHLVGTYPDLLALVRGADEPWLWLLLEHLSRGTRVTEQRVGRILSSFRIRRLRPEQVVSALQPLASGRTRAPRAQSAMLRPGWAEALYQAMRARGLTHERALRGVADRLLARLVACLRDGVPYDQGHQGRASRLPSPSTP